MIIANIDCCYRCQERRAGCHSDCPRYVAAKAQHEAKAEAQRRARQKEIDYRCYQRSTVRRRAKSWPKNKGRI